MEPVRVAQVGSFFERMPLTKTHVKVGLALFIANVIEAWELMILIFSSGAIAAEFGLTPVKVGALLGAMALGTIPGVYIWGTIMDKIGRKKTTIWGLLIHGVFSLVSVFSMNFEMLYASRLLAGFGISAVLASIYPYFEEMVPVKTRGRATTLLSIGFPLGTLAAIGVTTLVGQWGDIGFGGWRAVLFLSTLASLWVIAIARIPESPYWLISVGNRQKEAKEVIEYLSEGQVKVDENVQLEVFKVKTTSYLEIFNRQFIKITVIQTVANFTLAFGYWGLFSWLPKLLQERGLSLGQSLVFMALTAVCQIPGYMASAYFTTKYGRKKVMALSMILAVAAGFGVAFSANLTQLYVLNFLLSFFNCAAWGIWTTWYSEFYPTRIRGAGHAFGNSGQRWANMSAPTVIGFVLALGWGFVGTVSFIQCFMVATAILILFLPETEGKILE